MSAKANSTRTIIFALGANFAIFLAKGVAALLSGSGAMLAEAIHSLADTGNQGLLLLGMRRAKRPPSPDFPLGYGKERSEEHTSELQSLMRISYAVFCLKKKKKKHNNITLRSV